MDSFGGGLAYFILQNYFEIHHCCSYMRSLPFFYCQEVFHSTEETQLLYPFTCGQVSVLFPVFHVTNTVAMDGHI